MNYHSARPIYNNFCMTWLMYECTPHAKQSNLRNCRLLYDFVELPNMNMLKHDATVDLASLANRRERGERAEGREANM